MKKTLLLFSLLISMFVSKTKAQSYYKFLNNSSWCQSVNDGFGQSINYYVYKQSSDTIINNISYSKILVTGGIATFFAREDTIAKKVFIRNSNDTSEVILYDFSLNVGDTLYAKHGWGAGKKLVLRTIDTITTLVGLRQRFNLSDSSGNISYSTIESIGSIQDPFLNYIVASDPVYFLVCSYQNNTKTYDGNLYGYNCYTYDNVPCNANFTYTKGLNGSVTFTNTSPTYSSHWSFYGMTRDTTIFTSSVTINFSCNTTFSVCCTVSVSPSNTNTCMYCLPQGLNVNNVPSNLHPSYTYTVGGNGQIDFTNTSTAGDTNNYYYWSITNLQYGFNNGSGSISPSFTEPINQYYVVTLEMISNNHCFSSTYTDTIYNGVNTTGIKSSSNNNVNIYPNPNNGNFIIETPSTDNQTLQIFDVTGKMVLNQNINGKINIDASNLDNGVYFVQVKTKENISTQKIIVQH